MDINVKLTDTVFNYRVGAIILYKDKILLESKSEVEYLAFPGGRVKENEDSLKALKRELKEEMDLETTNYEFRGIIENFFTSRYGSQYHEIAFYYALDFLLNSNYLNTEIINREEKKSARFKWYSLSELEDLDISPSIIKEHLLKKDIFHYINRED